jgi:hypothetical protein
LRFATCIPFAGKAGCYYGKWGVSQKNIAHGGPARQQLNKQYRLGFRKDWDASNAILIRVTYE